MTAWMERMTTQIHGTEGDMRVKLRYVVEDTDRHGNVRIYYRKPGQKKVRLRGPIGSPEFLEDYDAAAAGRLHPRGGPVIVGGSLRWLCVEYFKSAAFQRLDPRTQYVRRGILERICQNNDEGAKPYRLLLPRHIRKRRDAMADRPEAANGMVKALRQLYSFAVEYDHHDTNPAKDVSYLSTGSEGFHAWTAAEIEAFENTHPVGTMARLALALALYTGQRRADIVSLGKQHVHDGWLVFTQNKNRNRKPVRMEIPIHPELQRIIDATPHPKTTDSAESMTFLVTAFGRPFTSNGFGNRFRKWCDEANIPHCSVHGLRKSAASRLAELGRSEDQIKAITGHKTSKEVDRYTRAARQKVRAESAMEGFEYERSEDKSVPLSEGVAQSGTKPGRKPLKDKA